MAEKGRDLEGGRDPSEESVANILNISSDVVRRGSINGVKDEGYRQRVDDGVDSEREEAQDQDNTQAARYPFEVGWDDGDADPLNPRSMSPFRKWLIVFLTCSGSFCV